MKSKFKVIVLLLIAGVFHRADAQKLDKVPGDAIRVYNGPRTNQKLPVFPGGQAGYNSFVASNTHYPSTAIKKRVQGMAFIQFVVEKDGSLSNIKLLKDPGEGLGAEAVRVIKLSPKWSPGTDKDVPVRVQMIVPVRFVLPRATITNRPPIS